MLVLLCLMLLPLRVMFIGAHPDDDSGATAFLTSLGAEVTVVTLSRGEGGGNAVGGELGRVREAEQKRALGSLGIERLVYLDRPDWGYTTSYAATAERWDAAETRRRLIELVRRERPDVIITMNPYPSGHGHHQFAARMATEAYFATEGPRRLLYALSYGQDGFPPDFAHAPDPLVAARELAALRMYESQGWGSLPEVGPAFVLGPEAFAIAHSRGGLEGFPEPGPRTESEPAVSQGLAPAPAVAEYRDWALGLGLRPLLPAPEAVMVLGRPSTVSIEVTNRTASPRAVEVSPPACQDLTWETPPRKLEAPPGRTLVPFTGVARRPGRLETPVGLVQVVPFMTVPRAGRAWVIDGLPEVSGPGLPLSERWEGAESRVEGRFWLEHAPDAFYLFVDVTDDAVASQLEDPSAHWRTDAVELTLDPSGRSQSTLSTFKLAIVPFTRGGAPAALRDADARPGPVSGVELASRRTERGYAVEARIPRGAVGELAEEFGLNVLLYDADDLDAPTGANLNLSRLAWSAWPEVMGNPRLWGRARLEGWAESGSKGRRDDVQLSQQTAKSRPARDGRPPAGVPKP